MKKDSKKRRARASSAIADARAASHAFLSGEAAAIRGQPATKAFALGSSAFEDQPGRVAKSTGSYRASSAIGFGGAGHAGHTGQLGHCAGGAVVHAASARIAAMWVILLEMAVALGLLILIVWWTWPKKK
ncbi:MAG TPA: hypothetical protein VFX67_00255 [Burkholderiales bacterium]|nr:hypothetical protein [Burkholderiales bacterium]